MGLRRGLARLRPGVTPLEKGIVFLTVILLLII